MITEMKAGHLKDIDKPSEPFEVIGKIIPRYENENWTFTELLYEAPYLKSYQDEEDEEDEEADCLEYIDNTDKIIYLYYQDDKCVGKVKLRKNWNRYAYIEDIAVCKDFRGQGIGSALINKGLHRKRLISYGGLLKEIHKKLNLDDTEEGDLIHTDDDEKADEDGFSIIAMWNWERKNYFIKE